MKVKWRNIFIVVGMFIVVILLLDFSQRIDKTNRLADQLEAVQAEATSVMETQVGLITQIAYATSDLAVEEWAYEDGKWVKPGEMLVEIIPAGGTPVPTDLPPDAQTTEIPKWRTWWNLFFGDQP